MSARPVYSIVAPVYNEAGNLRRFCEEVATALEPTGESWELILVDDGSSDGSQRNHAGLGRGRSAFERDRPWRATSGIRSRSRPASITPAAKPSS